MTIPIDKRPKSGLDLAVMMLLDLLSELRRLQVEANATREIVQAMATLPLGYSHEAGNYCVLCHVDEQNEEAHHEPDCPVIKARALLETNP
jgi:hypothetical protein